MRTISQREMRNESGAILREVAAGESFEVTNGGIAVARLVPIDGGAAGLPVARGASRRGGFEVPALRAEESSQAVIDDLRGER